jgi:hypothetical protein
MTPSMDLWKSEAQVIRSRCGFCGVTFDKWQDRVDHLAKEFRAGAMMNNWKGCRGLDPHVAALVSNAMPVCNSRVRSWIQDNANISPQI